MDATPGLVSVLDFVSFDDYDRFDPNMRTKDHKEFVEVVLLFQMTNAFRLVE